MPRITKFTTLSPRYSGLNVAAISKARSGTGESLSELFLSVEIDRARSKLKFPTVLSGFLLSLFIAIIPGAGGTIGR